MKMAVSSHEFGHHYSLFRLKLFDPLEPQTAREQFFEFVNQNVELFKRSIFVTNTYVYAALHFFSSFRFNRHVVLKTIQLCEEVVDLNSFFDIYCSGKTDYNLRNYIVHNRLVPLVRKSSYKLSNRKKGWFIDYLAKHEHTKSIVRLYRALMQNTVCVARHSHKYCLKSTFHNSRLCERHEQYVEEIRKTCLKIESFCPDVVDVVIDYLIHF